MSASTVIHKNTFMKNEYFFKLVCPAARWCRRASGPALGEVAGGRSCSTAE